MTTEGVVVVCIFAVLIGAPIIALIVGSIQEQRDKKSGAFWERRIALSREFIEDAEHELQRIARRKAARESRPPTPPANMVRPESDE